jgi:hypothetical protein
MVSSSGYAFLIKLPFFTGKTLNCKLIAFILGYPFVVLVYVGLCELRKKSGVNKYCVLSGQDTESS